MLKSVILGAGLSAFAFFGAAHASIVTVSYSGSVTMGVDGTNAFGVGGAASTGSVDLAGQSVVLTYVFDTARGVFSNAGGIEQVLGGGAFPGSSPAVSAAVTINNTTVSFSGSGGGEISASDAFGASLLAQSARFDDYTYASSNLTAALGGIPNSITAPLTAALDPFGVTAPYATGSFSVDEGDASGFFFARSVAISVVPLPPALPLFGLAVIGLGAATALRRNRNPKATR